MSTEAIHDEKDHVQHVEMSVLPLQQQPPLQEDSQYSKLRAFLALCALSMTFGSQLGVGSNMTPSVLTNIAAEFDATAQQGWISSGWLLSTCVAFIIAGRLSDIFGRRIIITGSNVLAIVGFAMCAFTSSFSVLIGGIIILGFAGGLAQTATAAACEIVPNKYRPVAIAFLEMAIAPTGYLAGSTISHLIIANTTYKWIFRLGMILCGVAFMLCILFYRPPPPVQHQGKTRWQLLAELDYVGMTLFAGGLGVLLMGVIWAAGEYNSKNIHIVLPLVIGLVSLAACGVWQVRMGDKGLIPPRLFIGKTRSFTLPIICHFVAGTVFFGQIALWPMQSGIFYAKDLIEVGILGLPSGIAVFVGGCVIGPFIPKLGKTNYQLTFALVVMVVSLSCNAVLSPYSKAAAIALQVVETLPFHWIVNLCFLSVQFAQHEADIGIATGLCGAARSMGGTVAVSIYLTIVGSKIPVLVPASIGQSVAGDDLPSDTVSALIGDLMAGNGTAAAALPGVTDAVLASAIDGLKWGYQHVFRVVYLATLGFGGCGLIAAPFVKDVSHLFTDHVAVSLEQREETSDKTVEV